MNRQQRRAAARTSGLNAIDIPALLNRAAEQHRAGAFGAAEALYRQVLAAEPAQYDALHLLGVIAHERGRHKAGIELIGKAIALKPDVANFHGNLANALFAAGRTCDALAAYDRAIALTPHDGLFHYNRGRLLQDLEREDEALTAYDEAVRLAPKLAPAWVNRGNTLRSLKRYQEALESYDHATALTPDMPEAWSSRGNAFQDLRRPADAAANYAHALALRPGDGETWFRRGLAMAAQHLMAEALDCQDRALDLLPRHAGVLRARVEILVALHRPPEALAAVDAAIAADAKSAELYQIRASILLLAQQYAAAVEDYRRALAIDPACRYVAGDLLHARMQIGDWSGMDQAWSDLRDGIVAGKLVATPFVVAGMPSDAPLQQRAARLFAGSVITDRPPPAFAQPRAAGPVRVAYLSADMHVHATTYLLAATLEQHDPARVDVSVLSYGPPADDSMRQRVRHAVPRFEDVSARSDEQIAARMRALGIDIAIDLKGYTANGRPGILGYRGAPLQVSFLGFPGTLGSSVVDYILADAVTIPPGEEAFYTEHVVRLPGTYQPCDPTPPGPAPSRVAMGLPETGFVFCCFNNSFKITPEIFGLWLSLLAATPGSVLWLLATNDQAAASLRRSTIAGGIDPSRVIFAPFQPREAHLARQTLADLALDTRPYNAHTTGRDALIAGLPMITCPFPSFAGRVGASLLTDAGLAELIVPDLDRYRSLALSLTRDPVRLNGLRTRLSAGSGRGDPARFAYNLEIALITMWERHRAGLPPAGFDVA